MTEGERERDRIQVTEEKLQEMRRKEKLRTWPEVTADRPIPVRVKEECKVYIKNAPGKLFWTSLKPFAI
jgi:hypothetical protein